MKEGITSFETLLSVELFMISENLIYKMREQLHNFERVFDRLPELTINTNKDAGTPIEAKYFHQFVGMIEKKENPEVYAYFNLSTTDSVLYREIEEWGSYDKMFEGYDFNKLLKPFMENRVLANDRTIFETTSNYIIIKISFTTTQDYYSGGYECEVEFDVVGYLDNKLVRHEYKDL